MTKEQLKKVLKIISESFGISEKDLLSYKRTGRVSMARHTLYRSITHMGYNLSETGEILGRDHTTILHGLKVYRNLYSTDDIFKAKAVSIREKIKELACE